MKLWKLTLKDNATVMNYSGYDVYDSLVVAAETEDKARDTHPTCGGVFDANDPRKWDSSAWAAYPDQVKAEYLGEAASGIVAGVIVASFNAG